MEIAFLTSKRSTCRVQVGAVAIKDNRIIMSGYNGGLPGEEHCIDVGCEMEDGHCVRTIHAEQNLIVQCAKQGISIKDAIVYVTHKPCAKCYKLLAAAGIKEIIYKYDYGKDLLGYNLVKCFSIDDIYYHKRVD